VAYGPTPQYHLPELRGRQDYTAIFIFTDKAAQFRAERPRAAAAHRLDNFD